MASPCASRFSCWDLRRGGCKGARLGDSIGPSLTEGLGVHGVPGAVASVAAAAQRKNLTLNSKEEPLTVA